MTIVKNTSLIVLSILLSLIICEGFTRFFDLAPKINWINPEETNTSFVISSNPTLGYEFKKSENRKEYNLFESFPFTNEHGFRDYPRKIVKNGYRILLLGDSVVAGSGIEKIENLIGPQLEKKFNCKDIEVISMGVSGYNLAGEAELLKVNGLKFIPDLVIHLITDNDFNPNNTMIHQISLNNKDKFVVKLIKGSHLFRFLSFNIFKDIVFPEFNQLNKHLNHTSAISVKDSLDKITKLATDYNFKVMHFLWPSFDYKKIYKFSAQKHKQDNIIHILKAKKLNYYTIDEHFKHTSNNIKKYTVGDYMHVNEYGASIAADTIYKIITKNITFDSLGNSKCLFVQE